MKFMSWLFGNGTAVASKSLYDVASAHRQRFLDGEERAVKRVAGAYAEAAKGLEASIKGIEDKIEAYYASGGAPGEIAQSWLFSLDRFHSLLDQVHAELNKFSKEAADITADQLQAGLKEGAKATGELVQHQTGSVEAGFKGLHKGAFTEMVGILSTKSPVHDLFAEIAPDAVAKARGVLGQAMVEGWNPRATGKRLAEELGISQNRATLIARTESIRAYRYASSRTMQENADIITGWRWFASHTDHTCPVCLAMDGSDHPVGELMESHPACRCTMVPILRTREGVEALDEDGNPPEGGDGGTLDDSAAMPFRWSGAEWFDQQPEEAQRRTLGPGKFDLFSAGKIELDDLVEATYDDRWGKSLKERSLKSLNAMVDAGTTKAMLAIQAKADKAIADAEKVKHEAYEAAKLAHAEKLKTEAEAKAHAEHLAAEKLKAEAEAIAQAAAAAKALKLSEAAKKGHATKAANKAAQEALDAAVKLDAEVKTHLDGVTDHLAMSDQYTKPSSVLDYLQNEHPGAKITEADVLAKFREKGIYSPEQKLAYSDKAIEHATELAKSGATFDQIKVHLNLVYPGAITDSLISDISKAHGPKPDWYDKSWIKSAENLLKKYPGANKFDIVDELMDYGHIVTVPDIENIQHLIEVEHQTASAEKWLEGNAKVLKHGGDSVTVGDAEKVLSAAYPKADIAKIDVEAKLVKHGVLKPEPVAVPVFDPKTKFKTANEYLEHLTATAAGVLSPQEMLDAMYHWYPNASKSWTVAMVEKKIKANAGKQAATMPVAAPVLQPAPILTPAPVTAPTVEPKPKAEPKPKKPPKPKGPKAPDPIEDAPDGAWKLDPESVVLGGTKTGGKAGSNEGAFYTGTDGQKFYVKYYTDAGQAYGEFLANDLYRKLGVMAPEAAVFTGADGKTVYVSKIVENKGTLGGSYTEGEARLILKGFAADVLVANWDAVGMSNDNIVRLPNGGLSRIDNGGSFLMRANAGRKPVDVLDKITEWENFQTKNPVYAKVFDRAGFRSPEAMGKDLIKQIDDILAVEKQVGGWRKYVDVTAKELPQIDRDVMVRMLESRSALLAAKKPVIEKALYDLAHPPPKPPVKELHFTETMTQKYNTWATTSGHQSSHTFWEKSVYKNAALKGDVSTMLSSWGSSSKSDLATKAKAGTSGVGPLADMVKKATATRAERWRNLAEASGLSEVPTSLTLYRGTRGQSDPAMLKWVLAAWQDDTTPHMKVLQDELASWSTHRSSSSSFYGDGGALFKARVPFENTYFDKWADDGSLMSGYFHENEVIAGGSQKNAIACAKADVIVKIAGKDYTYDQREAAYKAYVKKYGGKVPTIADMAHLGEVLAPSADAHEPGWAPQGSTTFSAVEAHLQLTAGDYLALAKRSRVQTAYQKFLSDEGCNEPPAGLKGFGSFAHDDPAAHAAMKSSSA